MSGPNARAGTHQIDSVVPNPAAMPWRFTPSPGAPAFSARTIGGFRVAAGGETGLSVLQHGHGGSSRCRKHHAASRLRNGARSSRRHAADPARARRGHRQEGGAAASDLCNRGADEGRVADPLLLDGARRCRRGPEPRQVYGLALSPEGKRLATANSNGTPTPSACPCASADQRRTGLSHPDFIYFTTSSTSRYLALRQQFPAPRLIPTRGLR
jgi:hypothetical protein